MQPTCHHRFNHSIRQTMLKSSKTFLTWVIWRRTYLSSIISTTGTIALHTVKLKGLKTHLTRTSKSTERVWRVHCRNWMTLRQSWNLRENRFLTCARLSNQLTPVIWCKHKSIPTSKWKVVFRLILQMLA